MTVLGYSTQILLNLAPLVTTIATIVNAIAIVVLVIITGLYAHHTKKLADFSKEQAESSKELAKTSEESTRQAREQSSRMMRALIVPEVVQVGGIRWTEWGGKVKVKNGGNGPAIQPTIQVLDSTSEIAYVKRLAVLLEGQSEESDFALPYPSSLKDFTAGRGTKLEYRLEVYWSSVYEIGHTKSVLPFTINIDSKGDATLIAHTLNFEWPAVLRVKT